MDTTTTDKPIDTTAAVISFLISAFCSLVALGSYLNHRSFFWIGAWILASAYFWWQYRRGGEQFETVAKHMLQGIVSSVFSTIFLTLDIAAICLHMYTEAWSSIPFTMVAILITVQEFRLVLKNC
jgi:hypothetical protein